MRTIIPSAVSGRVGAPPSKSAMIRAVAAALLGDGTSAITGPSFCGDALSALSLAAMLGARVVREPRRVVITGNGGFAEPFVPPAHLHCGESGLCMRMFPSFIALTGQDCLITAEASLMKREVRMVEALRDFGAAASTRQGYPPVGVSGRLTGSSAVIDGSVSSQFLSGLLMALPLCDGDSEVKVTGLTSRPYVAMTVAMAEHFGVTIRHSDDMSVFHVCGRQRYQGRPVTIEGDWSGASFLLVAGAIAGEVTLEGLCMDSHQADRAVLSVLHAAGADCRFDDTYLTVKRKDLKPFEFDARDCPDLVPALVALAAHCPGTTRIYGTERLKHKESDRRLALASGFGAMGVPVTVGDDVMEIRGMRPGPAVIDPRADHRIAMACAVAALGASGPVAIAGSGCVRKSYAEFFTDLESIKERP